MNIKEIREKFPQYNDLTDGQLIDGLYKKHYSDIPRPVFDKSIGYTAQPPVDPANVAPPIAGAGPGGSDLNWNDPGYPQAPEPQAEGKWYQADPGPYSGTLIPASRDEAGQTGFDSDAGIVGVGKRAASLTGEVLKGEIDPTSPEGLRRAAEMAFMISPMAAASRAGAGVMGGKSMFAKRGYKQQQKTVPTRQALKKAASNSYDDVAALDVKFDSRAVGKFASSLEDKLNANGFFAEKKGGVDDLHGLLQRLKGNPEDSFVGLNSLDIFRQRINGIIGEGTDSAKEAGRIAINAVDDFIASTDPSRLVAGAAPAPGGVVPRGFNFSAADAAANAAAAKKASDIILKARGNSAAGFRSKTIQELEEIMGLRASAANSGMNLDNTSRQKLVSLLTNAGGKGVRGFNQAEKDAIKNIIHGTKTKNRLRKIGNKLGGGGGLGQTFAAGAGATAGAYLGGSTGAMLGASVPYVVGGGAKALSNRLAMKQIKALDDLIRTRSPLYQNAPTPAPVYQLGPTNALVNAAEKAALSRLLMDKPRQPVQQPAQLGPNGGLMINGVETF